MEGMRYPRFKTEEELLRAILRLFPYNSYPKVSAIGGRKINPDIDMLLIERTSQYQRTIGYEIKLIKFDKRNRGISWNSFYSGIGQALLYLRNGVNRAFLVLGFHDNILNDELIDEFLDQLQSERELLKRILGNYISIGIYIGYLMTIVWAEHDFHPPDERTKLLSEELLHGKFTFDKRLKGE
jgi:hypothetical protein